MEKGLRADEWCKGVAEIIGGKGGGKEYSAQSSGSRTEEIDNAVEAAKSFANLKLN